MFRSFSFKEADYLPQMIEIWASFWNIFAANPFYQAGSEIEY